MANADAAESVAIKTTLIEKYGVNPDTLKHKRLETLKNLLSECEQAENVINSATTAVATEIDPKEIDAVLNTDAPAENTQTDLLFAPYDPKWTETLLSHLTKEEMFKDKPKVAGLRRLATKIFGPLSISTNIVQAPTIDNASRATVVVSVWPAGSVDRTVTGAADAYPGNTGVQFGKYPVAIAETRAKGRALTELLCLNVISAEEVEDDKNIPTELSQPINDGMMNGLTMMSSRVGVDLMKLCAYKKYAVGSLKELSLEQGKELAKDITNYAKAADTIPDEIKRG